MASDECVLDWRGLDMTTRAISRAAIKCFVTLGFFVIRGAIPASEVTHFMSVAGLDDGDVTKLVNDAHWISGVDIPSLSALVETSANSILGHNLWSPIGTPSLTRAATQSRMILTKPKFQVCAVGTAHLDVGVQVGTEFLNHSRSVASKEHWKAYPWNSTSHQSYTNAVKWSIKHGTRHGQGTDAQFASLPLHSRSPRLGLTVLTIFTDTGTRDGPTILVPRSHKEIVRRLKAAGDVWLNEWETNELSQDIQHSASELYHFTGKAGDSVVMHPLMVHSRNTFLGAPTYPSLEHKKLVEGYNAFRLLAQTAVFMRRNTDLETLGEESLKYAT